MQAKEALESKLLLSTEGLKLLQLEQQALGNQSSIYADLVINDCRNRAVRRVECKEIEKQELLKQALEHASDRGINASMLVYCQHQFTEALGDLQERVARTYELASAEAQVSLARLPTLTNVRP